MINIFKVLLIGSLLNSFFSGNTCSQELPVGYLSYYTYQTNSTNLLETFAFKGNTSWNLSSDKSYIRMQVQDDDSTNNNAVPTSWGVISEHVYGEFIMEFDFRIAGSPKPERGAFYFMAPVKSCHTYYAINFGSDSIRFYFVENDTSYHLESKAHKVELNQWRKVRVERDMLSRKIVIITGGDRFSFSDRKLVIGNIGFGTQNVNSHLRNISIWAPTAITDKIFSCE